MEENPIKSQISRYLFVSLGATLSLASLTILAAHSHLSRKLLEREIQQRADTIAHGIEFATEGLIESQQPILLKRVVQNYATLPGVLQIEIISPTGQILTSSPNDQRVKMLWEPVRKQLQSQLNESNQKGLKFSTAIENNNHPLFVQILPFSSSLFYKHNSWGEIIVVLDLEAIHQENYLNFYLTAGLSLAGIAFLLGGTIFFLRQRILQPLHHIQSAIAQHSGNHPLIIPLIHEDEIGFLAQTLQQKFTESETLTAELDQRVQERTEELQNAQEFLQTLLEYLPVALFVKDASSDKFGQILLWNHRSEEIFGLSAEQVLGKTVHELHPKEQADFFQLKDQETVTSRKLVDISEEPANSEDPGIIYLHTIKVPLFDRNGNPQYLLGISEDITVRKQAEDALQKLNQELELRVKERTQALQESESRYRNLLDQASDAILIADMQGNLVEVNQKAIQLFGYSKAEMVKLKITDLHTLEEFDTAKAAFQQIVDHRSGQLLNTVIICKDGNTIGVDITGSMIEYSGQQYIQGIFRDISERKQAELEIQNALTRERELNQLKTQFINVASHEFRTPLTVILGNVEFAIKYHYKLSEKKKLNSLEKILKAALRLRDMIQEILVLSRIDADKTKLEFQGLDIEIFCHETIEDIQSGLDHKRQILVSLIDQLGVGKQVDADPKILYHVLSNLLINAIKYSEEEDPIECVVQLFQSEVIFKITDHGIGIPPNDLPTIFESFHRASNVENIPGTGLGLNIVKRYIELHGGSIEVESQLNVGSTFTVKLPRNRKQEEQLLTIN